MRLTMHMRGLMMVLVIANLLGFHRNPPRLDRYIGACKSCGHGAQLLGFLVDAGARGFALYRLHGWRPAAPKLAVVP